MPPVGVSVTNTSPVVFVVAFTVKLDALTSMLFPLLPIAPEPDDIVRVGVAMLPVVSVMVPEPLADNVTDVVPVRVLPSRAILPLDKVDRLK